MRGPQESPFFRISIEKENLRNRTSWWKGVSKVHESKAGGSGTSGVLCDGKFRREDGMSSSQLLSEVAKEFAVFWQIKIVHMLVVPYDF